MRGHGGKIRMQNRACRGRDRARTERGPDTVRPALRARNEETGDERKAAREATDSREPSELVSPTVKRSHPRGRRRGSNGRALVLHPLHSPVTTDHQTGFSWNRPAGVVVVPEGCFYY